MDSTAVPTTSFDFDVSEDVRCVEFSTYESSACLLACGGDKRITVLSSDGVDGLGVDARDPHSASEMTQSVTHLVDYHVGASTSVLEWSPLSRDAAAAGSETGAVISLAAASGEALSYFHTTVDDGQTLKVEVGEHSDGDINALSFARGSADDLLIASVGDDGTCRLWNVETQQEEAVFGLQSAGLCVDFSATDDNQLLVAEMDGTVRILDTRVGTAVRLFVTEGVLRDVHWSPVDSDLIGGVGPSRYLLWDVKSTDGPSSGQAHRDGQARWFRWSTTNKALFSTCSVTDELKIWDCCRLQAPRTHVLPSGRRLSNASWSASGACCAVGAGPVLSFRLFYL